MASCIHHRVTSKGWRSYAEEHWLQGHN
jgi:hypothetical protein